MTIKFIVASLSNSMYTSQLNESNQICTYSALNAGSLNVDEILLSAIVFGKYNVVFDSDEDEYFCLDQESLAEQAYEWLREVIRTCPYIKNPEFFGKKYGFDLKFDDVPMTKIWDIRGEMIKMLC